MRWAPCALTQSSCPPGRTVSSRPIRSERQGGTCKVSRERAMGENVSITPWDAASRPDLQSDPSDSAFFDTLLRTSVCLYKCDCMHTCMTVCVCACITCVQAWQWKESRLQRWKVWPEGYMREKWAHYSCIENCTKKNRQTNKLTREGGHTSLDLCGCFCIHAEMMWTQWKS